MSARERRDADALHDALVECSGSVVWADRVAARSTNHSAAALLEAAEAEWADLEDAHVKQAFEAHAAKLPAAGDDATQRAGELALQLYSGRFGYPFVSATPSRAADELLMRVRIRLGNEPPAEWRISCDELRRAVRQRLELWLDRVPA